MKTIKIKPINSLFPFAFLAWEYYNTGSLFNSAVTCLRDFLWPVSVVIA